MLLQHETGGHQVSGEGPDPQSAIEDAKRTIKEYCDTGAWTDSALVLQELTASVPQSSHSPEPPQT
jgi:hypothetical protein